VWIKICGMTTPEAVAAALDARADAVGFVFAESVRQLSPVAAARLAAPARGKVACVAVTRHPSQQVLDEILEVFRPDMLQTDAEDFAVLQMPAELRRLPVLRSSRDKFNVGEARGAAAATAAETAAATTAETAAATTVETVAGTLGSFYPRILFEGLASGTGKTCDWDSARQLAILTELVLAGGLNADNVARAITEVRPFGVDVSSGVESRPGVKNPAEIARFVMAARTARAPAQEKMT
jgi:phosphoribosylanthranilate isomerase